MRIYLNAEYVAIIALLFYLGEKMGRHHHIQFALGVVLSSATKIAVKMGFFTQGKNFFKMKSNMAMTNRCRISAASLHKSTLRKR